MTAAETDIELLAVTRVERVMRARKARIDTFIER